ncbi:MAG: hypothetical protein KF873_16265 [Gemmataceae bacterium]|nr:hypothetical protein [Planctomycetia bacterium]MBX3400288.1 hypothetical protein [Gemmataceae bacterium]
MPVPNLNDETAEPQSLDEILDWHSGQVGALIEQRAVTLHALQSGSRVNVPLAFPTENEIESYFQRQRRELDRLTVLNLVASAEATIRVDFFHRVRNRLKDRLSVAYRDWFDTLSGRKQLRPDFDEQGILTVIKQVGVLDNHLIGQFRECLQARHWIGHGRFWAKPVAVDALAPVDVLNRANIVIRAVTI